MDGYEDLGQLKKANFLPLFSGRKAGAATQVKEQLEKARVMALPFLSATAAAGWGWRREGPALVVDSWSVWPWHFPDLTFLPSDRDAIPTH